MMVVFRFFAWLGIFLAPLVLWWSSANVTDLIEYGAPRGQLWYLFSKLFGLYAVLGLWLQSMMTILKNSGLEGLLPTWTLSRHKLLGVSVFLLILFHASCFVWAVSLRKESFAWGLLLPNLDGFYHVVVTLGWLALVVLLIAFFALVKRSSWPILWRKIHRFMLLVVMLGFAHGFLIGTETRYSWYVVFYALLCVSYILALVYFLLKKASH